MSHLQMQRSVSLRRTKRRLYSSENRAWQALEIYDCVLSNNYSKWHEAAAGTLVLGLDT